jgi:hypothetical protein
MFHVKEIIEYTFILRVEEPPLPPERRQGAVFFEKVYCNRRNMLCSWVHYEFVDYPPFFCYTIKEFPQGKKK